MIGGLEKFCNRSARNVANGWFTVMKELAKVRVSLYNEQITQEERMRGIGMGSKWMGLVLLFCAGWLMPAADRPSETVEDVLDQDLFALQRQAQKDHRDGKYQKAAAGYIELLKYNRRSSLTLYNLACCYLRLDETRLALTCLRQAASYGRDLIALMEKDSDFEKFRQTRDYRNLCKDLQQLRDESGEMRYIVVPKAVPYWLRLPSDYSPQKRYPLVIALHGYGGNPANFRHLSSLFMEEGMILAMPQGAYDYPQDGMINQFQYTFGLHSQNRDYWKQADLASSQYIDRLAQELKAAYAVDSVYLLGFSEGGVIAYQTAILNPQLYRGVLAFGAYLPDLSDAQSVIDPTMLQAASGLRVLIAHGETDTAVPIDRGRQTFHTLEGLGYTCKFLSFPLGHVIPGDTLREGLRWIVH